MLRKRKGVVMFDFKKLSREEIKDLKAVLNKYLHSKISEYKVRTDYLDGLSTGDKSKLRSHEYIEKTVRDIIECEFGDRIKNPETVNILTDAVVHRLKKQDLKLEDEGNII